MSIKTLEKTTFNIKTQHIITTLGIKGLTIKTLSTKAFNLTTLSISKLTRSTLSITKNSNTTLSIKVLITSFSIKALSITTQQNHTQD